MCFSLSLSPSIIIEKSKLSCCWYSMLLSECDFFYFALHVETWHIIVDCIQDQVVYAHERKKFFKRSFVVISINYTPTWWWSWSWVIWLCLHIQLFWGWLSSLRDDCLEKLFKKKKHFTEGCKNIQCHFEAFWELFILLWKTFLNLSL